MSSYPITLVAPRAPGIAIATSVTTASGTLPASSMSEQYVMLSNVAAVTAYWCFGSTAVVATGYPIAPNSEIGPVLVPEGELTISAILGSSTGVLQVIPCRLAR